MAVIALGEGRFVGYLNVKDVAVDDFAFAIRLESGNVGGRKRKLDGEGRGINQAKKMHVAICPRFKEILATAGLIDLVHLRMEQRKDDQVEEFVKDLQELGEKALARSADGRTAVAAAEEMTNAGYYVRIVNDLAQLGWDRIEEASENLREVKLRCWDGKRRLHLLRLKFGPEYPHRSPECFVELPEPFKPSSRWSGNSNTTTCLQTILSEFESKLERYQQVWDMLDDLDAHVWVIEPVQQDRSILFRRIILDGNASIHVQLSVESPRSVCECQFFGGESVIGSLRERFNLDAHTWDLQSTVRQNLERILQIEFPSPRQVNKDDLKLECGICYSFRLPESNDSGKVPRLPDRVCDNIKCGRPFHSSCLSEWLRALPSTRHSFDTMFGECPYCHETISVSTTK